MTLEFQHDSTNALALHQSARIIDGKGVELRVHSGEVWLTQEGDSRDVILFANQSFRLDRNGIAMVHAFESAFVQLRRSRLARRASAVQWIRAVFSRINSPQLTQGN